jgi:hypothetical protein
MDSINTVLFKISETKRNYAEVDPRQSNFNFKLMAEQHVPYVLNCNYGDEFRENTDVLKHLFFLFIKNFFLHFTLGAHCSAYQKIKSKKVAKIVDKIS